MERPASFSARDFNKMILNCFSSVPRHRTVYLRRGKKQKKNIAVTVVSQSKNETVFCFWCINFCDENFCRVREPEREQEVPDALLEDLLSSLVPSRGERGETTQVLTH